MKKTIALILTTLAVSQSVNAILIERSPQGQYNRGNAPVVDYELLSEVRARPRAPQTDDIFVPRVYTYNNNTSEYLRDELGLPRVKAAPRYNQYDSTYIPITDDFKRIQKAEKMRIEKELKAKQFTN